MCIRDRAKRLIPGKTNKDKGKILSHRRPKVDLNVLKGTRYEHLIKCLEAREEENKRKRRAKKLRTREKMNALSG